MITVYYLGNEFIAKDSMATKAAEQFAEKYNGKIKFIKIDTFEDLIDLAGKKYFMDVCEGISKLRIIDDLDVFANIRTVTAHDMDFGFFLQLNDRLGQLEKVKIICLPAETYSELDSDLDKVFKLIAEG